MRVILISFVFFTLVLQFSVNAQDTTSYYSVTKTKNLTTHQDTVQALTHLFQRKRKSTRVKAAMICFMIDVLAIRMWSHPHELPQGGQAIGTPTVPGGSSVPVSRYIAVGVASAVTVEIVTQQRFGQKRLKSLLDDYEKGKPIPSRIKSKLSTKDFN